MQVPAARHDVGKLWPAHEACKIAPPPAALLHRIAEQHHRVGRRKANLRMEGELTLARPELDLDRAQRQAKRDDEIGRASCRERVEKWVGGGAVQAKEYG